MNGGYNQGYGIYNFGTDSPFCLLVATDLFTLFFCSSTDFEILAVVFFLPIHD